MRVPWRWILPVVPLLLLITAWHSERQREGLIRALDVQHATHGEIFREVYLWASHDAYEQHVKAEPESRRAFEQSQEPEVGWPENFHHSYPLRISLAWYLNLPGVLFGGAASAYLLKSFDIPMTPTFYLLTALVSFIFWYSAGDWIERRRAKRQG